MDTLSTFKENVRKRLRWLRTTPGKTSRAVGRHPNWLAQILGPKYAKKVGSDQIDATARALGVEPWELIDPEFNPAARPDPEWCQVSK